MVSSAAAVPAAASPPPAVARPAVTAALLAYTAGFVDTCGFIALFGLFTAHVTGNFVLIGAYIATEHQGIVDKLLALPVFVLAVALTHLFVLNHRRVSRHTVCWVLGGQIFFLTLFLLVGIGASPFASGDAPLTILTGMLGVTAMGIQNAASRSLFASLSPTTIMTGNVTQLVIDLVELMHSHADRAAAAARLRKIGLPVATFTAGALTGALGYRFIGFACLAVPILTASAVLWAALAARAAPAR